MKTTKNIIGLGVMTRDVVFAFMRSIGNKMNRKSIDTRSAEVQLT